MTKGKEITVNGNLGSEEIAAALKPYDGSADIAVEFKIADGSLYAGLAKKITVDAPRKIIKVTFDWVQMVQTSRFHQKPDDEYVMRGVRNLQTRPSTDCLRPVKIGIPDPDNPSGLLSIKVIRDEEYLFSVDPIQVERTKKISSP